MTALSSRFVRCFPGLMPNRHLIHLLRRLHPTVRLLWNPARGSWQLVERMRNGQFGHVRFLDGEPTMANTVFWLNEQDAGRLENQEDIRNWIARLDAKQEAVEKQDAQAGEDRIAEGHDRMYHAVSGRKVFQKPT